MSTSPPSFDRPILITGASRCGKGRVVQILARSPEFHYFHEPLTLWRPGGGADDTRTAGDASDAVKLRMHEHILAEMTASGTSRYLDDFAFHLLWVPYALEILPDARFIHVVRNGEHVLPETYYAWTNTEPVIAAVRHRRDLLTWRSLPRLPRLVTRALWNKLVQRTRGARDTMGPRVPGMAAFRADHGMAEVAAYQWQQLVEIGLDALEELPPERVLTLRFEDLFDDTANQLERLISFTEASDPDAVRAAAADYIDPSWRPRLQRALTEADWVRVRRLIEPTQRRLGYLE